nr:NfeD family protein [Minwuia thermotolerans]
MCNEIRGDSAEVLDWSGDEGHVWARSERWAARGATGLAAGDAVRVRGTDGLTLIVDRDGHDTDDDPETTNGD